MEEPSVEMVQDYNTIKTENVVRNESTHKEDKCDPETYKSTGNAIAANTPVDNSPDPVIVKVSKTCDYTPRFDAIAKTSLECIPRQSTSEDNIIRMESFSSEGTTNGQGQLVPKAVRSIQDTRIPQAIVKLSIYDPIMSRTFNDVPEEITPESTSHISVTQDKQKNVSDLMKVEAETKENLTKDTMDILNTTTVMPENVISSSDTVISEEITTDISYTNSGTEELMSYITNGSTSAITVNSQYTSEHPNTGKPVLTSSVCDISAENLDETGAGIEVLHANLGITNCTKKIMDTKDISHADPAEDHENVISEMQCDKLNFSNLSEGTCSERVRANSSVLEPESFLCKMTENRNTMYPVERQVKNEDIEIAETPCNIQQQVEKMFDNCCEKANGNLFTSAVSISHNNTSKNDDAIISYVVTEIVKNIEMNEQIERKQSTEKEYVPEKFEGREHSVIENVRSPTRNMKKGYDLEKEDNGNITDQNDIDNLMENVDLIQDPQIAENNEECNAKEICSENENMCKKLSVSFSSPLISYQEYSQESYMTNTIEELYDSDIDMELESNNSMGNDDNSETWLKKLKFPDQLGTPYINKNEETLIERGKTPQVDIIDCECNSHSSSSDSKSGYTCTKTLLQREPEAVALEKQTIPEPRNLTNIEKHFLGILMQKNTPDILINQKEEQNESTSSETGLNNSLLETELDTPISEANSALMNTGPNQTFKFVEEFEIFVGDKIISVNPDTVKEEKEFYSQIHKLTYSEIQKHVSNPKIDINTLSQEMPKTVKHSNKCQVKSEDLLHDAEIEKQYKIAESGKLHGEEYDVHINKAEYMESLEEIAYDNQIRGKDLLISQEAQDIIDVLVRHVSSENSNLACTENLSQMSSDNIASFVLENSNESFATADLEVFCSSKDLCLDDAKSKVIMSKIRTNMMEKSHGKTMNEPDYEGMAPTKYLKCDDTQTDTTNTPIKDKCLKKVLNKNMTNMFEKSCKRTMNEPDNEGPTPTKYLKPDDAHSEIMITPMKDRCLEQPCTAKRKLYHEMKAPLRNMTGYPMPCIGLIQDQSVPQIDVDDDIGIPDFPVEENIYLEPKDEQKLPRERQGVYKWTYQYAPSVESESASICNIEEKDQEVPSELPKLFPLQRCMRSRQLGLSRKQRVPKLHPNFKVKHS